MCVCLCVCVYVVFTERTKNASAHTHIHAHKQNKPLMPAATQSIPYLQKHTEALRAFEALILWPSVPTFTSLPLGLLLFTPSEQLQMQLL